MTILVTGATGTVGRQIVAQLHAAGPPVRALTRDPSRADFPAGVEVVRGDLTDPASLTGLFDGVDAAHFITFGGDEQAPLQTGEQLVAMAERGGVGSVTVLDGPDSGPFDAIVEASSLRWTRIAPVGFMSNALWWADSIRDEGVVREPFASNPGTVVHEADIAAVAVEALTTDKHGGQLYTVTGPEAITVFEQVAVLSAAIGREVRVVDLDAEQAEAMYRAWGFDDETVEFFLGLGTNPPEASVVPQRTVEQVTGRAARTFREWAGENASAFG